MKYIGIFLFCIAVNILIKDKIYIVEKRRCELSEFSALLRHIKREIGIFAKPVCEALAGFSSDSQEIMSFSEKVLSGIDISAVFSEIKANLALSGAECEILERLFSFLGKGYLNDSVKAIENAESELSELRNKYEGEAPKKTKIYRTVSIALCVGLIIAVI